MKAALYIRVSTHYQIDKDSLPFQRKELINYCKYALNIEDYEVFEDAGYSGKDTIRPAYQDMMRRIKAGEFTHLLVWKIDRVSRNLKDFTEMYDELKDYRVTFVSKNEQFDTSSAMGEAMLKIILVFAELERKLTAERVYSIMLSRAEKGLWNGCAVPLGYDWCEETQFAVVSEEEAKTVRFIFDKYEELKSTGEVKHALEVNNIRTKKDRTWTTKTISDVIRNPFYKGTYRYNYRYSTGGKIRPKEEWVVVDDNHQAIISKEQYKKVNDIMNSNAHGRGNDRTLKSHTHIFTGLINCTKCNKNYISAIDRARADGYQPSVYRCFNYVHSKKEYRTCSGAIGEVKLGPFIINYIANLGKANDFIVAHENEVSEKEIENILLSGPVFKEIAGIVPEDLKKTHDILLRSTGNILCETEKEDNPAERNKELESLNSEKKKIERALKRLEDLYLFSDESMAEKDFLIRKQDLEKKFDKVSKDIKERVREESENTPSYDLSFIRKATKYFIGNSLSSDKPIDYNKFVKVIDKKLLQSFMRSVIKKINIAEDRRVLSIEFANGITHRFVYRT